jgi:hypothetical protein
MKKQVRMATDKNGATNTSRGSQSGKTRTTDVLKRQTQGKKTDPKPFGEGKYQTLCRHCKKVVPQTPMGEPEVTGTSVCQDYICSICKKENRVETRVR